MCPLLAPVLIGFFSFFAAAIKSTYEANKAGGTLSSLYYLDVYRKTTGVVFTTIHFQPNVPNKLEYYIIMDWKGMPAIKSLAYCSICKL